MWFLGTKQLQQNKDAVEKILMTILWTNPRAQDELQEVKKATEKEGRAVQLAQDLHQQQHVDSQGCGRPGGHRMVQSAEGQMPGAQDGARAGTLVLLLVFICSHHGGVSPEHTEKLMVIIISCTE